MRHSLLSFAAALALAAASPAHADWFKASSKHFVIYGDGTPDELREFATKVERFDQAVRNARAMEDPPLTDSNRLTIYLLKNVGELARLEGRGDILGIYTARASDSLAFVARNKAEWKGDMDSDVVFFHEYSHHLLLQNSTAVLPSWLIEGFAEFLSTAKMNPDGTVTLGGALNFRSQGVLSNHHELPLTMMLRDTFGDLTLWQEELLYARGWLLTHYLTFEPSRRGQLDKYVAGIQQGQKPIDSAWAAFGDLKRLDWDLDSYANRKNLSGVVINIDQAKLGSIAVRPLTTAEAAIMPVRIRSEYGVGSRTAPGVAEQARKLAAPFANDPFVQSALAEAEYDASNYAAADAAADRALAADPRNLHALIYKGRAQMKLAKAKGTGADWNEVRSWFLKANKVDTEDAEPLALFYRTFKEAGQTPSKNASGALLYAVTLAPQDDYLRLMAVRQLLVESRTQEARTMLAPLAYQPHATGEFRSKMTKVMDAISASDAKTALSLIDADEDKKD